MFVRSIIAQDRWPLCRSVVVRVRILHRCLHFAEHSARCSVLSFIFDGVVIAIFICNELIIIMAKLLIYCCSSKMHIWNIKWHRKCARDIRLLHSVFSIGVQQFRRTMNSKQWNIFHEIEHHCERCDRFTTDESAQSSIVVHQENGAHAVLIRNKNHNNK